MARRMRGACSKLLARPGKLAPGTMDRERGQAKNGGWAWNSTLGVSVMASKATTGGKVLAVNARCQEWGQTTNGGTCER
jgi:hypothetical protein